MMFGQRAGAKGVSFTYFTAENAKSAKELITILREAKSAVPQELEQMAMYSGGGSKCTSFHAFGISFSED